MKRIISFVNAPLWILIGVFAIIGKNDWWGILGILAGCCFFVSAILGERKDRANG